jgi:hypothetical protein
VRLQSREKHAFSCFHCENVLSDVHVEFSFEYVEELVLTGMDVGRRFGARY